MAGAGHLRRTVRGVPEMRTSSDAPVGDAADPAPRSPATASPPAPGVPPPSLAGPSLPAPSLAARIAVGTGRLLIALVAVVAILAAATRFVEPPFPVPARTALAGGVALTVLLTGLAAHRAGGRTLVAAGFAVVAGAGAGLTGWPWLVTGAAGLTAVSGAVLAVLATRPADRLLPAVREYVLALLVALVAAVGAAAYSAPVRPQLLLPTVSACTLALLLWMAWRLGGGWHGVGARGLVAVAGTIVVVAAGVAYGAALQRWGGPQVTALFDSIGAWMHDRMGATVPPLELLVGFPALLWGLATRAEKQQGWWVCAFGGLATAGIATSLAVPDVDAAAALLGRGYAALVGLALGLVVWRLDRRLSDRRGHAADTAAPALQRRDEPRPDRPLR